MTPHKIMAPPKVDSYQKQDSQRPSLKTSSALVSLTNQTQATGNSGMIHFVFGLWDDIDKKNANGIPESMPIKFQKNLEVWLQNNPKWTVRLWLGKAEIESMVQEWSNSSEVIRSSLDAWRIARPIQKADLFRYLLLYKMGGIYLDLDVQCVGNNNAEELMQRVGLNTTIHTAALFWEMGRLSAKEQAMSAKVPFRQGIPEYSTRLSNYAIWSQPESSFLECVIRLATARINRVQGTSAKSGNNTRDQQVLADKNRYPIILYSSGPDVVTECAFGVRDVDTPELRKGRLEEDEETVNRIHSTKQGVLVVDPGPNLVNGNTFSWKNRNAA